VLPLCLRSKPSLDINQYAHTAWTVREGFFKGAIYAIAQTPDGYLWLGTGFGLLRFDGVRSLPWQAPPGEHLPSSINRALVAARDGTLWIGTDEGLASWRDGKLTQYPELAGQLIAALLEDREGTIWAGVSGTPTAKLCAIQRGRAKCYGGDGSLGRGVYLLYEDKRGNLWAGAETGLWRWKPGSPKLYPTPDTPQDLIEGDNGALLIAMPGGIRQLIHGKAEAYPLPGSAGELGASRLLGIGMAVLDRNRESRPLACTRGKDGCVCADRRASPAITLMLSSGSRRRYLGSHQRWIGPFSATSPFETISVKQGLSNASVGFRLAARDGSVWLGTLNGLNRWNDGQITAYHKRGSGLPDDYVRSLLQDDRGRIWVSTRSGFTYVENGRFIHTNEVPGGTTWPIVGDRGGNSGSATIRVFFTCFKGVWSNRFLGEAGTQGLRLCSIP